MMPTKLENNSFCHTAQKKRGENPIGLAKLKIEVNYKGIS